MKYYDLEITEIYKGKEFYSNKLVSFARNKSKKDLKQFLIILINKQRYCVENIRTSTVYMTATGTSFGVQIKMKLREIRDAEYWLKLHAMKIDPK